MSLRSDKSVREREGKADLASKEGLTVTVESPVTTPGGTVHAVVTITGEPDRKVRAATVRLLRNALSKVSLTNVTDHGSHDSFLGHDVVIAETPLTDSSGQVLPGEHAVSFALTADALPSAPNFVAWSVEAIIDRRHGIDVKAHAPFEVLSGPDLFVDETTSDPIQVDGPGVELELPVRSLRPGDTIAGNVVLRPPEPMTITRLIVAYVWSVGTATGHHPTQIDPVTVLLDEHVDTPLDLQAGDTRTFPFELTLPDDALPTVLGPHSTPPCFSIISWNVVAVATRVLSPGEIGTGKSAINLGINVYNAPVSSTTTVAAIDPGSPL